MESPAQLVNSIISFALLDPRIDAVVMTGSRARKQDIDSYSDLDIEFIGHGVSDFSQSEQWLHHFATPLVALQLANSDEESPDWPTCLVIFEQGRKIDFMLAEPERLTKMKTQGLDEIYARGYTVLLDKTGIAQDLPIANQGNIIRPRLPSEKEFNALITDFWFEAHQVAILLTRDERWLAWMRDQDMKSALLNMLEWRAILNNDPQDIWYQGKHFQQWMPARYLAVMDKIFNFNDIQSAAQCLLLELKAFAELTQEIALLMQYPTQQALSVKMSEIVNDIFLDNNLSK
nr:aminoglycoside 6-adenylyltransferase [uncultured Moellerella sp.]